MKEHSKNRTFFAACVFAFLVTCTIALKLWSFHFSSPFVYEGTDDFVFFSIAKNVMSGNFFWKNSSLAAPVGQELYRFPMLMAGYTFFCRLVSLFGGNWVTAVNLYYIMTYVLAFLAFVYCGKVFEIESKLLLIIGGLTYSFWSYHYLHGNYHMTAIAYFVVPVFISVCYQINQNRFQSFRSVVILIILSAGIGLFDIYYSFFGCFLLSVGLITALLKKQYQICGRYLISIFSIVISIGIALLPAIINMISESSRSLRSPGEAYYWALQLDSLFVPAENSRSILRGLSSKIRQITMIPQGENLWNYVGIIGIAGIGIIIYWLFTDQGVSHREKYVCRQLGATLLLGTVGGLSIFVALFVTSSIRCYNRISTYVFAFLILAFCLFADRSLVNKKWGNVMVLCLFLIHMIDMSPWSLIPDYNEKADLYYRDRAFFQEMENSLEDGDVVLQLPYMTGIENSKIVNGLGNSNHHFKAYLLCEKDIRWSFGSLSGTDADKSYKKYDTTKVNDILVYAFSDHYSGIYLDKSLYTPKEWETVYGNLCSTIGEPQTVSPDGGLCYFELKNVDEALFDLKPVYDVSYGTGFYSEEKNETSTWHWSEQDSSLTVASAEPANKVICFHARTFMNSGTLSIATPDAAYEYELTNQGLDIEIPLQYHSGVFSITFHCDSAGYENGDENLRYLSFMLSDLIVKEREA